jgi:methyl-accepting chemotaxis protein
MISYTMPLYKDSTLVGVAGIDISFEFLRELILTTSVYETGHAFLLSDDYTFIVDQSYTDADRFDTIENGRYLSLLKNIQTQPFGVLELDYLNKQHLLGYYVLPCNMTFGVIVPSNEVFKSSDELRLQMMLMILLGLLLSILLGFLLSKKISQRIIFVSNTLMKMANLDYTSKMPTHYLNAKDEVGDLSRAIDTMQKATRDIIDKVMIESNNVTDHSISTEEEMASLSQEITDVLATTQELSASMQETAASMEENECHKP